MDVHMGLRQKIPVATVIGVGILPSHSLYCNGGSSTLGLETETRQKGEELILYFDSNPKATKSRTASVTVLEGDYSRKHVQKLLGVSDNCHPVVAI